MFGIRRLRERVNRLVHRVDELERVQAEPCAVCGRLGLAAHMICVRARAYHESGRFGFFRVLAGTYLHATCMAGSEYDRRKTTRPDRHSTSKRK